ncbi:cytidylate kinase-like family protein [Ramlibacter montanisoli]|uniref:cytidylate kinase-like family protein n=1 Tax=Ramlibacter montanisoli TaxID=2732512 RepID=UPI00281537F7|nr:cytidylate kinase family protein [Ramlibacter montanisoli]
MAVIALTQEMGSLAKDVALRLAEVGQLAVMRNEVVDNIAGRMHVPASLIRRLREGQAGLVERLSTDKEQIALFTAEEMFAQAVRGNVVLRGWGATVLLRPVRHVVRVRVTRPFEQRLAWLMDHLGTTHREAAETELRRSDQAHASRMHAVFGVTWGDPCSTTWCSIPSTSRWKAASSRSSRSRAAPSSRRPRTRAPPWKAWR